MARTRNNQLIGAAAAAQKRDTMNEIIEASLPTQERSEKESLQSEAKFLRNSIRCLQGMADPAFEAKLTGDLRNVEDRLSELEAAEILEWLDPSPADYDATDPAAVRQSQMIGASIAANWNAIPEIPL